LQETPIDRNEWRPRARQPKIWEKGAALLVLLPWLLLIGGGISMCVLYQPGERIGTVGYVILAIMLVPLLAALLGTLVLCSWWRYLDLDCTWCGRSFYATDLPTLLQTGRCPGCGQPVPGDDLQDLE
jgi:hypothetical protein